MRTYHIGRDPDGAIHFLVSANSGGGFFNPEWVALEDIRKVLEKIPEDQPITAVALYPLFRGKSVNTPAFLLAVLIHEKLVTTMKGKRLRHVLAGAFAERVEQLVAAAGSSKGATKRTPARKTAKKAPARKRPASTRRKKASEMLLCTES